MPLPPKLIFRRRLIIPQDRGRRRVPIVLISSSNERMCAHAADVRSGTAAAAAAVVSKDPQKGGIRLRALGRLSGVADAAL